MFGLVFEGWRWRIMTLVFWGFEIEAWWGLRMIWWWICFRLVWKVWADWKWCIRCILNDGLRVWRLKDQIQTAFFLVCQSMNKGQPLCNFGQGFIYDQDRLMARFHRPKEDCVMCWWRNWGLAWQFDVWGQEMAKSMVFKAKSWARYIFEVWLIWSAHIWYIMEVCSQAWPSWQDYQRMAWKVGSLWSFEQMVGQLWDWGDSVG